MATIQPDPPDGSKLEIFEPGEPNKKRDIKLSDLAGLVNLTQLSMPINWVLDDLDYSQDFVNFADKLIQQKKWKSSGYTDVETESILSGLGVPVNVFKGFGDKPLQEALQRKLPEVTQMSNSKLLEDFREIRKVSTPWCAVRTTDYISTINTLLRVKAPAKAAKTVNDVTISDMKMMPQYNFWNRISKVAVSLGFEFQMKDEINGVVSKSDQKMYIEKQAFKPVKVIAMKASEQLKTIFVDKYYSMYKEDISKYTTPAQQKEPEPERSTSSLVPACIWTCVSGVTSPIKLNTGENLCLPVEIFATSDDAPFLMFKNALSLPEYAILFVVLPDDTLLENTFTIQAISDLRDEFKMNGRTLVLLGIDPKIPPFLSEDIPILDDPLPVKEELEFMIQCFVDARNKALQEIQEPKLDINKDSISRAAGLCLGMTRFAAEETIARKVKKSGIDFPGLSQSQRAVIEQSSDRALMFEKETWKFDDIGGMQNFKSFMDSIFTGPKEPNLVVRIDEIDKSITAASSGQVADNTGVSQDLLKCLLTSIEDNKWMGLLAVGPPGCLRGDTVIYDPVSKDSKTVRQRFLEGKSFNVYSFDEITDKIVIGIAKPVHRFPVTEMIEFTLETGEVFAVTPRHLFWNGTSYVSSQEIFRSLSEFGEVHLPSIGEPCLLTQKQDALRWKRIIEDYSTGYQFCLCSYGEQPQRNTNTYLERLPSQDDALSHNQNYLPLDVGYKGSKHNHPYRSSYLLSNKDCFYQFELLTDNESKSQIREELLLLYPYYSPKALIQPQQKSLLHKDVSLFSSAQESMDLQRLSSDYSLNGRTTCDMIPVKVIKAREVLPENYYDFLVPVFNNYVAHGIIHHNSGKTLASICTGNQYQRRTLSFDMGATKGSLVGQSEQKMRRVMQVIKTMGEENVLFIATCNRLDTLPPELQRRFWLGTWFWDLPTPEEKKQIWKIQRARYKVDEAHTQPSDDDWSGSDIRNCCQMSWVCGASLVEAARYITITGKTNRLSIESLRDLAERSEFRSVTAPGAYKRSNATKAARRISN